jgi:putative ABC transport system substrate-binding protein
MRRRRLLAAIALVALAPALRAQPLARRKLGILGIRGPGSFLSGGRRRILDELASLGYAVGRNLELEERYEDESPEGLQRKAHELAALRVDAILTEGTPATLAARTATRSIPIVTSVADPVAAGLAKELRRPTGNVTGLSQNRTDLSRKLVELIRLLRPQATNLAFMYEEPSPSFEILARPAVEAARDASMTTHTIAYRTGEIAKALAALKDRRADAVMAMGLPAADIRFLASHHVVVFAQLAQDVESGALLSMENDDSDDPAALAAILVKVFGGTPPGEIPFGLPSRYKVVWNAKTASALGILLPQEVRLRVDRIVE